MLTFIDRTPPTGEPHFHLALDFDARSRSRLRVVLNDGTAAALMLPRGLVLRGGDCLRAEDGTTLEIRAAPECVSTAKSDNPLHLLRVAYHLGNRHVALEIHQGWLRYRHDHVLDDMVVGLGVQVEVGEHPFEPEAGAYGHHAGVTSAHSHA